MVVDLSPLPPPLFQPFKKTRICANLVGRSLEGWGGVWTAGPTLAAVPATYSTSFGVEIWDQMRPKLVAFS